MKARGLSKRYSLTGTAGLFRSWLGLARPEEQLWALRDLDLEVASGEALAVVGANGAGKSTLLKILAGILPPTTGSLEVKGRMASLIEVGAGFHPELSGRENIFLNGVIQGLTRAQVEERFHDIVAFSELEAFVDVPVKRYSTGMFARLGFSVSIHSNPQVLLVDEVLAVGDQSFQQKCIRAVRLLQEQGTAILMVSHNPFTILSVCQRAVWLEGGRTRASGPAPEVVREYQQSQLGPMEARYSDAAAPVRIVEVQVQGAELRVLLGSDLEVGVTVELQAPLEHPLLACGVVRSDGLVCAASNTRAEGEVAFALPAGRSLLRLCLPRLRLLPDSYSLVLSVGCREHSVPSAEAWFPFTVVADQPLPQGSYGVYLLPQHWSLA